MTINEDRLRELSDTIKNNNIHIIGIPEEDKKGGKKLFEKIITKNVPNPGKETDIQIHKAQKSPNKIS